MKKGGTYMIFNKEYDNSLWCLINGDNSNNHLITNFIHELPSKFIEQIKQAITDRQSILDIRYINPDLLLDNPNKLSGTYNLDSTIKYCYSIDVNFGELEIIKVINHGNSYERVFSISLELTDLPLTSILDGGVVGAISYTTKEKKPSDDFATTNNHELEYSISKNMFAHTITCAEKYGQISLKTKKTLDLSKLPQDINITDFPVITKRLPVERLVELEKYLRQEITLNGLSQDDLTYLEQAKKLPLEEFLKDREYYVHHMFLIDEIKYSYYLMEKYSCTKDELYDRYVTANAIRRYNNKAFNQMYKMRKKTIKQLTK